MQIADVIGKISSQLLDAGAKTPLFFTAVDHDGSMFYLRCRVIDTTPCHEVLVSYEELSEFVYPLNMMIIDACGAAYHVVLSMEKPLAEPCEETKIAIAPLATFRDPQFAGANHL